MTEIKRFVNKCLDFMHRHAICTRVIAFTLTVVLLFYVVPSAVFAEAAELFSKDGNADENVGSADASAAQTDSDTADFNGDLYEAESLREEYAKHFHLEDGSYIAAQYAYPVHYMDDEGKWQDIDNTLAEDSGGEFSTPNARIKFSKKINGSGKIFTLKDGDYSVTVSVIDANKGSVGTVTNGADSEYDTELQKMMNLERLSSTVTYADAYASADIEYVIDSWNIKENIIVKEKSDSYSYSFEFKLKGLSPTLLDSGDIILASDDTGEVIYTIPAPYAIDSAKEAAPESSVFYTLSGSGKKYTLTVTADSEWMNSDERSYPITVDPTVIASPTNAQSTSIGSNIPSSSSYISNYPLLVTNSQNAAYYKLESLPTIPNNAYVSGASLCIPYAGSAGRFTPTMLLYEVTSDWDQTTLTYNRYLSGEGAYDENVLISSTGLYVWDITDIAAKWYEFPSLNYGVRIEQAGIEVETFGLDVTVWLGSLPYGGTPSISVTYTKQDGLESYMSYSSHSAGAAGDGSVNLATGDLTFSIPTVSTVDSLMPITASAVYNSSMANTFRNIGDYPPILPYGFKLNLCETIVGTRYTASTLSPTAKDTYTYEDADGTKHDFFFESGITYRDNDGLQMKMNVGALITITDDSKTTRTFTKVYLDTDVSSGTFGLWVLTRIKDKAGNVLTIDYQSAPLRPVSVSLTPKNSEKITTLHFLYNAEGMLYAIYNSSSLDYVMFRYSSDYNGDIIPYNSCYLRYAEFGHLSNVSFNYEFEDYYADSTYQPSGISREYECYYYYNSDGTLSEIRDGLSNHALEYEWTSVNVTKITEKGRDENGAFVTGQELSINYGSGYTDVKDTGNDEALDTEDDITTRYVFDNRGRAVSVYSFSESCGEVYGATVGVYQTQSNVKNSLREQAVVDTNTVNYILNGSFETGTSFTNVNFWTFSGRAKRMKDTFSGNYGLYSLTMNPRASETDAATQCVHLAAGDYTLSFQVNASNADGVEGMVKITSISNSGLSVTEEIPLSKNYATSAKIDFSKTFTVPSHTDGGDNISIKIEFTSDSDVSSTPSVMIDNVTLIKGIDTTDHSIAKYGSFDASGITSSGSTSLPLSDVWTDEDGNAPDIIDSGSSVFGNAVKVTAQGVTSESYVKQRVYEIDPDVLWNYENDPNRYVKNTGFDFIISGYAKSSSPIYSGTFALRADVIYCQGEGFDDVIVSYYLPFIKNTDGWQFTAGVVSGNYEAASGDTNKYNCVRAVDLYCEYSNIASGFALFDNISVVDDSDAGIERYSYYANGLLSHVHNTYYNETYYYDTSRRLIRVANNYGEITEYAYTSNHLLDYSVSYKFTSTHNTSDNLEYPYTKVVPENFISTTPLIKTDYTYDVYGLCTGVESYEVAVNSNGDIVKADGAESVLQSYTYNTEAGSAIFGALLSEKSSTNTVKTRPQDESTAEGYRIETEEIVIEYVYDESDGKLLAKINDTDKSGTAYVYDDIGNVIRVNPMVYRESTDSYVSYLSSELVTYSYTNGSLLSSATTKSTEYSFTYDEYGNRSSVSAGERTLATYEYNENNGKLKKIIYGTGFTEEYVYDRLENLSEIWYTKSGTRTKAYSYEYTADGKLHKYTDHKINRTTAYVYDSSGRLVDKVEYGNGDLVENYVTTLRYDSKNRPSSVFHNINYTASGSTESFNCDYINIYDNQSRIEAFAIETDAASGDESYLYDGYNRVVSKYGYYTDGNGNYFANDFVLGYFSDTENGYISNSIESFMSTAGTSHCTCSDDSDEAPTCLAHHTLYNYYYDTKGNIFSIETYDDDKPDEDLFVSYIYDDVGQLTYEFNDVINKSYRITYDDAGNIVSKRITEFSDDSFDSETTEILYGYTDSEWGDLLTSYNGTSITYDAIGNPTSYYNGTQYQLEWNGRQLSKATIGSKVCTFMYNDSGVRTRKTVNGTVTSYSLNGSQIVAEETSGNLTVYIYDASGNPIGFQYHKATNNTDTWEVYWYEKNLHGDIVAVYNSAGTKLVSYAYDAWGNFETTYYNGGASTRAANNPFTYRGYYYDRDLSLYYLNSRYYDPVVGRFISPDRVVSDIGGDIRGYNLFVYCFNNPVNLSDSGGNWPEWMEIVGWVDENIAQPIAQAVDYLNEDIDNYDKYNDDEAKVLESHFFSSYNGVFVLRVPISGIGFSYGIIVLGYMEKDKYDVVKHEYGHRLQLNEMGYVDYTLNVALPSVVAWCVNEQGNLPFNYFSSPWESGADSRVGLTRDPFEDPWQPSDGYYRYLIELF